MRQHDANMNVSPEYGNNRCEWCHGWMPANAARCSHCEKYVSTQTKEPKTSEPFEIVFKRCALFGTISLILLLLGIYNSF